MGELRAIVAQALDEAGVLLTPMRLQRQSRDAFVAGRRLVSRALAGGGQDVLREAAASLNLAELALVRILGLGYQQAEGLAKLAGTPAAQFQEVAHLGALFNLGIVLFDRILDRFPERAQVLHRHVTPEFLEALLRGSGQDVANSGDAAIDALTALIAEYLIRCRRLGGDRRDQLAIAAQVHDMHAAERAASTQLRCRSMPSIGIWRALRRKSALPMTMMARLALLPRPHADRERRTATMVSARLAGQAIWIVDDLADIREDWAADCWSRPLWWLARTNGHLPSSAEDALQRVVQDGIGAAEAHRLARKLLQWQELAHEHGSAFAYSCQASVHEWLEEVPG